MIQEGPPVRSEQDALAALRRCVRSSETVLGFTRAEIVAPIDLSRGPVACRTTWLMVTDARLLDAPGANHSVVGRPWARVRAQVRRRMTRRVLQVSSELGGRWWEHHPVTVAKEFADTVSAIVDRRIPVRLLPEEGGEVFPGPLPGTGDAWLDHMTGQAGLTHEYVCTACGQMVGLGQHLQDAALSEFGDCPGCGRTVTTVIPLAAAYPDSATSATG